MLQTPTQKKSDLQYLKHLASEVGYVFYLVPGPLPGISQAYWGPETRLGIPQTALNVNMDTWTNVESLNSRYEPQNAVLPIIFSSGSDHEDSYSDSHSADNAVLAADGAGDHAAAEDRVS